MNTLFAVRTRHLDAKTARRLAGNCFNRLEALEALLSRYRHDSDVSRINQLKAGESLLISDTTHTCLQRSVEATERTAGLFDVTLGAQTRSTGESSSETTTPILGQLTLSPTRPEVICNEPGREIDLGGIGKGFALDEMATILLDLGASSALISCGASTHLAIGEESWQLSLRGDCENRSIELIDQALSASGIGEQGAHVVHPDTGSSPDYHFKRVWVIGPNAALADAFSTASLIMAPAELDDFAASVRSDGFEIYTESLSDNTLAKVGGDRA
ncbi:MAG: FAD:protein FMN transferase [Verrucomicrobiota bacterium]